MDTGNIPGGLVVRTPWFHCRAPTVQSLVRELTPNLPCSAAKRVRRGRWTSVDGYHLVTEVYFWTLTPSPFSASQTVSVIANTIELELCMLVFLEEEVFKTVGGSGWRGRWEGGSGWGRHVNSRPFHFNV